MNICQRYRIVSKQNKIIKVSYSSMENMAQLTEKQSKNESNPNPEV